METRRSSLRLQAKRQAEPDASAPQTANADDEEHRSQSSASRNRKRTRTDASDGEFNDEHDEKRAKDMSSRKRVTRKKGSSKISRKIPADKRFKNIRGKLGFLDKLVTDVPIEVILQIFCYLRTPDILHLARTSKALRDILMDKSSEYIWRTARANYESLPPLPPDLNEPQYANLMFSPHCHVCAAKARCETIIWEYRMRCCKKCLLNVFSTFDDAWVEGKCTEFVVSSHSLHQVTRLLPCYWADIEVKKNSWQHLQMFMPSVVKQHFSEYIAINDHHQRQQWIRERIRDQKALRDHIALCYVWRDDLLKERERELKAARSRRREDILGRLHQIGWADEARRIMAKKKGDTFSKHKLVNGTAKLTDRRWESIRQPLIEHLQTHKSERIKVQQRHALHSRYTLLKKVYEKFCEQQLQTILPGLGDILASELFDRVIWCTSFDQEWRAAREKELMTAFRKEVPKAKPSDLHLATSIFKCEDPNSDECPEYFWYPRMFFHQRKHPCVAEALAHYRPKHADLDLFNPFSVFNSYPWTPDKIRYFNKGAQTVRTIVEAYGLDPATATFDDMSSANQLLIECDFEQCKQPYERQFFWWMRAPVHANHHHSLSINNFGEYTEHILAAASEAGSDSEAVHCNSSIRCRLCNCHEPMSQLRLHLRKRHGISMDEKPTKDHWFWDPETPLAHLAPTLNINGTGRRPPSYSKWMPTPIPRAGVPVSSGGASDAED